MAGRDFAAYSLTGESRAPLGERIRSRRANVGAMTRASTGVSITRASMSGHMMNAADDEAFPRSTVLLICELAFCTISQPI